MRLAQMLNPAARTPIARILAGLLAAEIVVFGISVIPGVRSAGGFDPLLDGWLQGGAYVTAAALCAVRPVVSAVARPIWVLVATAIGLRALGFVVYLAYVRTLRPQPYPSLADACWLAFPILLTVAGVLFVRGRISGVATAILLDGVVGALAAGALGAALLEGTILDLTGPGLPGSVVLTNIAYPVTDLLMLIIVLGLLVAFAWRPPPIVWVLAAGIAGFAIVDSAYLYEVTAGTYRPGTYLALLSLVATSVIAVSPLVSPGRRPAAPASAAPAIVLAGVFAVTCLGVLVWGATSDVPPAGAVYAAALGLLVALARTGLSFREVAQLTGRLRRQTAQVQASEQAARAEAERLGAVLGGVEDYAIIGGDGQSCTFFSPGAEHMLGWRAEEVVGHHGPELFHVPAELDARARELGVASGIEALLAPALAGTPETRRWTYVRRDGSRLPVEVTVTRVAAGSGEGPEFMCVARDVSDEARMDRYRDARERLLQHLAPAHRIDGAVLDAALATITSGMGWDLGAIWLPEGDRLRCAGFRMTGSIPDGPGLQRRIVGMRIERGQGLAGQVWDEGRSEWVEDFQDYERLPGFLLALRAELGRELRACVAVPLRGAEDDAPIGVLQLFGTRPRPLDRDLLTLTEVVATTIGHHIERVRVAQELRFARDEAEAANRQKTELVSRISHELRTPLNAILGFAQLLEREELGARQQDQVGQIASGGRHLSALIDDLLDLGRIERGELQVALGPVSATAVLQGVLDLAGPLIAEREIDLEVDAHDGLYRYVMADEQRLTQVLLNLLSNAVKYNRPRGRIRVSFEQRDGRLRFVVADTGPGIARSDLARAFEPFERLSAADGPEEGTGLGLAVAQALVQAMGGAIEVASVPGEGATFTVDLAETDAPAAPAEVAPAADVSWWPEGAALRGTLLYVEDNPANLKLVEEVVALQPGLTLLTAMQGSLGLELARRHRPDVLLLDANLPDLDGEAVLERLRADDDLRDMRVLAMSADATPERRARLLEAGADAYMTKPLDLGAFTATLSELLQARRL